MEHLSEKDGQKGLDVNIWEKASRFYYSIGAVKESLYPALVCVFSRINSQNERVLKIRSEITERSESLHDLKSRVSAYNKKQSSIVDVC